MDSKLRGIAIGMSMAVILVVSLLVLYLNGDFFGREAVPADGSGQISEEIGATEESDAGQSVVNGQYGEDLSAFMRDEAFFDEEVGEADSSNRLSLLVTSVEKDLRIQIVDMDGEPVAGYSFYVEVDGLGEYKDLDKDGVIYIGGLTAGEYRVRLLPVEGVQVPSNSTRIRVKEQVEYVAIDDISLLILTEADIDALAEDTEESGAVADADQTEIQQMQKPATGTAIGIDVSKWNGEIAWDKVKNAGVEFVIIRAGYRGSATGALVVDPMFESHIKGATAAGLQVGVYFFSQAVNAVEAVEEASAVLELVQEYELTYPVFLDSESAGGSGRADGLDAETRTLVCEAFCRTVENAGYDAGVYASRWWYDNNLYVDRLEKEYFIWLAEYRSTPLYQGHYGMWQYTSKGQIDGIEGNVDINIHYR